MRGDVNPLLGAERLRADLPTLGLPPAASATPDDLELVPATMLPATARGALGGSAAPIAVTVTAEAPPAAVEAGPGVAVRMLTSGTTGPPSASTCGYEMLELVMRGAKHYETGHRRPTSASARVW